MTKTCKGIMLLCLAAVLIIAPLPGPMRAYADEGDGAPIYSTTYSIVVDAPNRSVTVTFTSSLSSTRKTIGLGQIVVYAGGGDERVDMVCVDNGLSYSGAFVSPSFADACTWTESFANRKYTTSITFVNPNALLEGVTLRVVRTKPDQFTTVLDWRNEVASGSVDLSDILSQFVSSGRLTITVNLPESELYGPFGAPTFRFVVITDSAKVDTVTFTLAELMEGAGGAGGQEPGNSPGIPGNGAGEDVTFTKSKTIDLEGTDIAVYQKSTLRYAPLEGNPITYELVSGESRELTFNERLIKKDKLSHTTTRGES